MHSLQIFKINFCLKQISSKRKQPSEMFCEKKKKEKKKNCKFHRKIILLESIFKGVTGQQAYFEEDL